MMRGYRKYAMLYRVNRVYIVLRCFELYTEMMYRSVISRIDNNYERSEVFCNLIEDIFNMNASIEDFMVDKDKVADEALRYYDKIQEVLSLYPEDKESIWAFCKAMYHYPTFTWLRGDGYIYMPMYLDMLMDYMIGKITKRQLEDRFVTFQIWNGGKKQKANFALARKTFMQVEDLFWSIKCKQVVRKEKKDGK